MAYGIQWISDTVPHASEFVTALTEVFGPVFALAGTFGLGSEEYPSHRAGVPFGIYMGAESGIF